MSKITDADIDARKSYLARLESEGMFETNVRTDWLRSILTELRALRSKSEAVGVVDAIGAIRWFNPPVPRGTVLYTHPAPQEAVEVRAVAKMIMLEMQGHDFGTAEANGNFTCSGAQIEELERCCNAAAECILSALTHPAPATGVSDALAALKAVEADAVSIGGGQSAISDETRAKVENAVAALTEEGV